MAVTGDLTSIQTYEELNLFSDFLTEQKSKFENIVVGAGNHKVIFASQLYSKYGTRYFQKDTLDPGKARSILVDNKNISYLEDSGISLKGVKFWGTSWIPPYSRLRFNLPSSELAKQTFAKIPEDTDVLISHSPPKGVMDRNFHLGTEVDLDTGKKKRERILIESGCFILKERVDTVGPKLHIFGHLHECSGWHEDRNILYVNTAIEGDKDPLRTKPKLIELLF